jgi:signal transduction histidine kinase
MPNGGTLTIRCYAKDREEGVVTDFVDEGTGVDAAIRAKIFEPFFTTKHFGTGLGLSICREIADFHHARLMLIPRSPTYGTIARVEFSTSADRNDNGESITLGSVTARRQPR